jgi:hypothetical protein
MTSRAPLIRTVTALRLCVALITLLSAALVLAAALVPAPAAVMPLVVLVGIGCPMGAAYELPRAVAGLPGRAGHSRPDGRALAPPDLRALADLRRHLDELPETQHPLGL